MQERGARPRHAVEHDQPQRATRHVDTVAHRICAKQARVLLSAEYFDQAGDVKPVDVLGIKIEAGSFKLRSDAFVNLAQPRNRGEQAERAATGSQKQLTISRRDLSEITLSDVGDDDHSSACWIVERRGGSGAHRATFDMNGASALLCGLPVRFFLAGTVAQRRRSDDDTVRRLGHGVCKRLRRIDPVTVHSDVDVATVDTAYCEPIDKCFRCPSFEPL